MGAERGRETWRNVAARTTFALEDRLRGRERASEVSLAPGVGERERGRVRGGGHELLDLALAHRLAGSPGRDLLDLGGQRSWVLADELDERRARFGLGGDAELAEALRDPAGQVPLDDVVAKDIARLGARLRERRILPRLLGDECKHRFGRGRRQILRDGRHVRCLPSSRQAPLTGAPPVDGLDEDEPRVAEEAPCVGERDCLRAARLQRRHALHGLLGEPASEPGDRRLHLRPVAPGEEVDGLQLRHDVSLTGARFLAIAPRS